MKNERIVPVTDPQEILEITQQRDARGNKTLILRCTKCNINTSGIYLRLNDTSRRCPICNSVLMHCTACHRLVSATEKFNILSCDNCHEDFVIDDTIEYLASREHSSREIVLSGIRATGRLHLGNYLGAVRQFVEYEAGENLCMYFIADWHTLTTCQDPQAISNNVIEVATDYLAAGLNPERSIIYTQSSVPEIAELALYLAMFQPKNQIEDMPILKDIVRGKAYVSMGHLYYPVLMAADILGPQATVVPVGSDQVPNVELACRLARKFNNLFGQTFVVPRVGLRTVKVPGLSGNKMGKSEGEQSIRLDDTIDQIRAKYLRHGVTDPSRKTREDPGNPDQCLSVYPVHKLLCEKDTALLATIENECRTAKRGCSECKEELARMIDLLIQPFREKREELSAKPKYVKEVLHFGGMKARQIILPTLQAVRIKLGIRQF